MRGRLVLPKDVLYSYNVINLTFSETKMGKNHRHSKKLKSEKSKVHIKTKTKFLPKGQNVTKTAFKIRPIVLQEQLKERQGEGLLSKKKANIDVSTTQFKIN